MKKAVIITGGARRVGAALVRHFAAKGYDVALHYSVSEAEARALQQETNCHLFQLDLRDVSKIPDLMEQVKQALPNVVALVNNASVFTRGNFMETDEALFDEQMNINFKAPFFLTQAFARTFGAGSVVNMLDSDIAKNGGSHCAYLLSKKALADFTLMAARDLGPKIRVNGVCPGIMLPSNELDADYMRRLSQTLPLRATATVEQTVSAVDWLVENPAITGQLVFVDGGGQL